MDGYKPSDAEMEKAARDNLSTLRNFILFGMGIPLICLTFLTSWHPVLVVYFSGLPGFGLVNLHLMRTAKNLWGWSYNTRIWCLLLIKTWLWPIDVIRALL